MYVCMYARIERGLLPQSYRRSDSFRNDAVL
jgi:hypothetical protein